MFHFQLYVFIVPIRGGNPITPELKAIYIESFYRPYKGWKYEKIVNDEEYVDLVFIVPIRGGNHTVKNLASYEKTKVFIVPIRGGNHLVFL